MSQVRQSGKPRVTLTHTNTSHKKGAIMMTVETEWGNVRVSDDVRLGELFVTEDGEEVEVVGLNPVRFEIAPEEDEDWGE